MSIMFLAICVSAFVVPFALMVFAVSQEESDNDQFYINYSGYYFYISNLYIIRQSILKSGV